MLFFSNNHDAMHNEVTLFMKEGCKAAFRLLPKQGIYPWEHAYVGISLDFDTELMSVVFQSERM